MSKIGKKPIAVSAGVTVHIKSGAVQVQGVKGELIVPILPYCVISEEEVDGAKRVLVKLDQGGATAGKQARANWGTMAALIKNAIQGVHEGFQKKLQFEGIGYRGTMEGKTLVLSVGFSHPVKYESPQGVAIIVEKNIITISGFDKALIGKVAAEIRKIKKPEPYQGKGIRYVGEVIRRKAGKKAAAASSAAAK